MFGDTTWKMLAAVIVFMVGALLFDRLRDTLAEEV